MAKVINFKLVSKSALKIKKTDESRPKKNWQAVEVVGNATLRKIKPAALFGFDPSLV